MTEPITPEFIAGLREKYLEPKQNGAAGAPRPAPTIKTARVLQTMTFPPLKWLVPNLVTEGLVLLAGKPKVRKSWMTLDIGLATADGRFCLGDRKCAEGSVLYLALEDGERRLQRRIDKILPFGAEWPEKEYSDTPSMRYSART